MLLLMRQVILVVALLAVSLSVVTNLNESDLETEDQLPHPAEIRLMEELAAWTGEMPTSGDNFPFPDQGSLTTSVQEYSESFSLFRGVVGAHGRSAALGTLPFGAQILRVAERYGIDPLLMAAIANTESANDPNAVSPVGAIGLMQLMPQTAAFLSSADEDVSLTSPARNLELGARYIRQLKRLYGGDVPLMLAAYNSGPGNVRKFGGIPPFVETQNYVERVLSRYVELQKAALAAEQYQSAEVDPEIAGS